MTPLWPEIKKLRSISITEFKRGLLLYLNGESGTTVGKTIRRYGTRKHDAAAFSRIILKDGNNDTQRLSWVSRKWVDTPIRSRAGRRNGQIKSQHRTATAINNTQNLNFVSATFHPRPFACTSPTLWHLLSSPPFLHIEIPQNNASLYKRAVLVYHQRRYTIQRNGVIHHENASV